MTSQDAANELTTHDTKAVPTGHPVVLSVAQEEDWPIGTIDYRHMNAARVWGSTVSRLLDEGDVSDAPAPSLLAHSRSGRWLRYCA